MLVGRSVYLLFTVHGRKDDLSSFVVVHSEFLYYLLETVLGSPYLVFPWPPPHSPLQFKAAAVAITMNSTWTH